MNTLKEELFALESEKIAGTLPPNEYAEQKAALETVLKRALKKKLEVQGLLQGSGLSGKARPLAFRTLKSCPSFRFHN